MNNAEQIDMQLLSSDTISTPSHQPFGLRGNNKEPQPSATTKLPRKQRIQDGVADTMCGRGQPQIQQKPTRSRATAPAHFSTHVVAESRKPCWSRTGARGCLATTLGSVNRNTVSVQLSRVWTGKLEML